MEKLDAAYWQQRYETGQTGWDLGHVSAPLRRIIDALPDKQLRILVPGAGNGYEVRYLQACGFEAVTVVDLAAAPLAQLAASLPDLSGIRLIQADYFDHTGQYDLQLEQTFFCALKPRLRPAYVQQAHRLLAPGGHLRGVLFNRTFDRPGPPFGGSADEYRRLFTPRFELRTLIPCDHSEEARQELLIDFVRQ